MDPRFWTIVLLALCTAALIVWDVYVAFGNRVPNKRDTISGILLGWSRAAWILPYAFGVLVGHLFLPESPLSLVSCPRLLCIAVLMAAGFMFTAISTWLWWRGTRWAWPYQAPVLLILGVLSGNMLWYQ
jgi:hypothetical protein